MSTRGGKRDGAGRKPVPSGERVRDKIRARANALVEEGRPRVYATLVAVREAYGSRLPKIWSDRINADGMIDALFVENYANGLRVKRTRPLILPANSKSLLRYLRSLKPKRQKKSRV